SENHILYFNEGIPKNGTMSHYNAPVDTLFIDSHYSIPFTGRLELTKPAGAKSYSAQNVYTADGKKLTTLYGGVVESGAPLTVRAFEIGLRPLFPGGGYLVTFAVLLFAISTSISWSYYG